MPFAKPPSAARAEGDIRFQDLEDELLILDVKRVERGVQSQTGDLFDAAVVDTYVCTGPHKGETFPGLWFMGTALLNQLTAAVGGPPLLGRMVKPAGKRYRLIVDADEGDEKLAVALFSQFADPDPEPASRPQRTRNPTLAAKPSARPAAAGPDDDEPPF